MFDCVIHWELCKRLKFESPGVKQTAVNTILDVYSTVIVRVYYDLFEHHDEKDDKQSRCLNTTLFHAVDEEEESREVAVQPNLATLVFVQLDNHADEFGRAAKAFHDHLQSFSVHYIKCFEFKSWT